MSYLQLRLQQTVEGLSVVAIAYYILALMGYGFDALSAAGIAINKDIATGIALPVVLGGVYWGVHSIRRHLTKQSKKAGDPLAELMGDVSTDQDSSS